jgi:AbrB family looped-hinge helix DNA binding protein
MKTTPEKVETVRFSTKGQVVIPSRFRKALRIEGGTRAWVRETSDGLLLTPLTERFVEKGFGLLKRPAGAAAWPEEWAAHKREERALEARRDKRHGAG